jgi:hypothetical protein
MGESSKYIEDDFKKLKIQLVKGMDFALNFFKETKTCLENKNKEINTKIERYLAISVIIIAIIKIQNLEDNFLKKKNNASKNKKNKKIIF